MSPPVVTPAVSTQDAMAMARAVANSTNKYLHRQRVYTLAALLVQLELDYELLPKED